jgi:hypothetical protein
MNRHFRLIQDVSELNGTCYIEFQRGRYKGSCWLKTSVFLEEESYGLLEPTIRRSVDGYDYYSFMDVPSERWKKILADLDVVYEFVRSARSFKDAAPHVGFMFAETQRRFEADFERCRQETKHLIQDFNQWVRLAISEVDVVSILGI